MVAAATTGGGPARVQPVDAPLLTDEGDLAPQLVDVLRRVFQRFARGETEPRGEAERGAEEAGDDGAPAVVKEATPGAPPSRTLTDAQLDNFARAVNGGTPMPADQKQELRDFFDVDEQGNITFDGFCEMYQMQTGSDENETWKDLEALGYNRQLELVAKSTAAPVKQESAGSADTPLRT